MAELNKTTGADSLKKQYGKGALNTYDVGSPLLSQVKKDFNLEGEQFEEYVPLSMGGGRGSTTTGVVPEAGYWKMDKAYFESVEVLSSVKLKRTFKYQTKGDGGFFSGQEELIKRGVVQFKNNVERQIMNGLSSGALGSIKAATSVTDNGSGSYTFYLTASTFCEANFEEGDLINIGSGSTDKFRVEDVDPDYENENATPILTVQRKSGSQVPAAGMSLFMQGSEGNEMNGARGILSATSGSVYGIPVSRRWSGFYMANYGKGINEDLLDQMVLGVHRKCGEAPNLFVVGHTQWRLLKSTITHQKRFESGSITPRFNVPKAQEDLMKAAKAGRFGFNALIYDSPFGSVPIVVSRFCRNDEVFAFNTEQMTVKHMRGFGWHDDDGTVWMREAGKTSYEARYGGDMQVWMPPTFHAYADGLTTA